MALLNYTTEISTEKSLLEIQKKLVAAKATAVLSEYADGVVTHISFRAQTAHGLMSFRLPGNVEAVHKTLQRQKVSPKYKTKEQAARVAWRIIKDWLEAQLALIQLDMVKIEQVFLPYAQGNDGQTVYERFLTGGLKMLDSK